jgi:aromatic ring-opening dioxygenase LigB subunit
MLAFAAIAPHGDIAIEEAQHPDDPELGGPTREAMAELARRFEASGPEATVVLTPHNVHVGGSFAVVTAAELRGGLGAFLPAGHEVAPLELACPADAELAAAVLSALERAGLPAVAASFGGNVPEESVMPMDWGTFVPLWHLGGRSDPPVPAVVVSPSRDRPLEEHVHAGAAIGAAAAEHEKRIALVASGDHGHAHDPDGPYGLDPAAAEYDALLAELVRESRLDRLLELAPLVAAAKADSLWQLLMLSGALGDLWRGELFSYEAPTYYGMLVAAFAPAA